MALAVTATATTRRNGGATINMTGGTALAKYDVTISQPDGSAWTHEIQADGSGAWTVLWPTNSKGSYTVTITPKGSGAVSATFTTV